jgi:hypothetical protein
LKIANLRHYSIGLQNKILLKMGEKYIDFTLFTQKKLDSYTMIAGGL